MRKGQTHDSHSHDSTPLAESGKDQGLYEKNMDTMRCILYLHGGEDHHLTLGILAYSSVRWLLLWKCRSREVLCRFPQYKLLIIEAILRIQIQHPTIGSQDQWPCFWYILGFFSLPTQPNSYDSDQLSPCPAVPVPLRDPGCFSRMYVWSYSYLNGLTFSSLQTFS